VAELGSHTADLSARAAGLADDMHQGLAELRAEMRGDLAHFDRSIRADSIRLRRELKLELASASRAVTARLDRVGARLSSLLVAGPLVVVVTIGVLIHLS
jgi:hypothetical protein